LDRPASVHLQPREIAELYYSARSAPAAHQEPAILHPHLGECSICRRRFEQCASLDAQLQSIRLEKPTTEQPGCPDAKTWFDIASGVMEPSQVLAQVQHASGCDHCGRLLHEAVADLSGETTEQDTELLAALPSARKDWQRRLAQRMAGKLAGDSHWWTRWVTIPRMVPAAIALVAVLGGTWWVTVVQKRPAAAQSLLAQAYTEQRTMELRIAGAEYAQPKVQLGPSGSFLSRSEDLLKAESLIADQMVSHPADPAWLQAKAQADLLEGRYDPAVESLRHAVQLAPKSPGLVIDLASAYFQRGLVANQPEDYGVAYEQLSRALAMQPDNAVALFNRAIVSEHQFLYRQALEDWEHYLRIDPNSQWSNEARQRAEAVRARLKPHEGKAQPLSPSQIVARTGDPSLGSEIDQRTEEYLDVAVRSWLLEAYPSGGSTRAPSAVKALFFLADLTAQKHRDRWLSDLLRGASSPSFAPAVRALTQAANANAAGDYSASSKQSALAERLFRASGNQAGSLRAQFEHVFAAQIDHRGDTCRRQAAAALSESQKYPYPWLHIQLELEYGVCSGLMGYLGAFETAAQHAIDRAQRDNYRTLYLRALGFVAEIRTDSGDLSGSWKLISRGLERYWSGQTPAMRGYSLYTKLAYAGESPKWPNLQLAIWREAVTLIDSDEDLSLRASAHSLFANAASAADQPEIAKEQYAATARLYALAPQTAANSSDRLESEIRVAQLEARENDYGAALERLTRIQSQVRQLSNDYLAQIFYTILGEVQLRGNRSQEAEQALRAAVVLAERNLCSLKSEADRINWSKSAAPIYLGLAEAELAQGGEQASLEVFEWYLGAAQRQGTDCSAAAHTRASQPFSDPSRLPSRLPTLSNQTVLAYGSLPGGVAIWIYDDRGVSAHWIPKTDQSPEELAARFYELASDPKSELNALRRDGRELYALLIAPIAPRLDPHRTLVIEADGWLARIPFELLVDSAGSYFLERGPMVHSLGLYADEQLRSGDQISPDSAALVVASTATPPGGVPPIGVREQAEMVARNFHHPRLLLDRDANLRAVTEQLQTANVFNFAGHSLVASSNLGLMMEDRDPNTRNPRLLDADTLRQLDMPNLQFAVLSACSTGTTTGAYGLTGFSSMADAFLRAGVPHVVASRWPVDSVATHGFVEQLYQNLLTGTPVAEAIRVTSLQMRSGPRTHHPYYWSAFAAYGRQ
jgi:CHAT domain-containing protein